MGLDPASMAPELADRLLDLSASRPAAGFGPRPPKRLLQALHLIHEHAAAVAYRPISFGNSPFLEARIQDLLSLRDTLDTLRPRLHSPWTDAAARLTRLIEETVGGRRDAFIRLERFSENTRFRRFYLPQTRYVPAFRLPLPLRRYRKVLVITGPGIGLGDEICAIPLVAALHRNQAQAHWAFYGFYSGLWRQVLPQAEEHPLGGHPLRCFDAVEAAVAEHGRDQVLALFINFGGLHFHQALRLDRACPDVVEIAVGAGALWFAAGSDGPIQVLRAMDPVLPGNYRALRLLSESLGGRPTADPIPAPPRLPGRGQATFDIVLSPFTSKPMLLQPPDWVLLLDGLRSIEGRKPLRCRVLPGTSPQSRAYAERIVALCADRQAADFQVECLGAGGPAGALPSLETIWHAFAAAHLVLGIDTYSVHLAALLEVPALTLCYERNLAFWPQRCDSLWAELRHPTATLLAALRLLTALAGGLQLAADRAFRRRHRTDLWRRLDRRWTEARALGDGAALDAAQAVLDAAWNQLTPAQRRLVEALDFNCAWPRLRPWLGADSTAPGKTAWAFELLENLQFRRLFRLFAAVGSEHDQ